MYIIYRVSQQVSNVSKLREFRMSKNSWNWSDICNIQQECQQTFTNFFNLSDIQRLIANSFPKLLSIFCSFFSDTSWKSLGVWDPLLVAFGVSVSWDKTQSRKRLKWRSKCLKKPLIMSKLRFKKIMKYIINASLNFYSGWCQKTADMTPVATTMSQLLFWSFHILVFYSPKWNTMRKLRF